MSNNDTEEILFNEEFKIENDNIELIQKLFTDNETFFKTFLKIKTKQGEIIPFILNEPQRKFNKIIEKLEKEGKPIRIIILKARQLGISTYIEAYQFKYAITNPNVNVGIITHKVEATSNLYTMCKLFYQKMPESLRPALDTKNANELRFNTKDGKGLNSMIKCMTAGSEVLGRAYTFQSLHNSEYAFWGDNAEELLKGLTQTQELAPGTALFIESTANGFNHFKTLWDKSVKGEINYLPVFLPWHSLKSYSMPYTGFDLTDEEISLKNTYNLTNDQLQWRREQIATNCFGSIDMFNQEYPSTPEEAFLSTGRKVFNNRKVVELMQNLKPPVKVGYFTYHYNKITLTHIGWVDDPDGIIKIYEEPKVSYPYVIGGDTAGDGSDNFTAHVINNVTGNQVARLLLKGSDEIEYIRQVICLGLYYNSALIGIETNFSTFSIRELERFEYPNIYVRERDDKFTNRVTTSYGFRTTTANREGIITELNNIFKENPELFTDYDTLEEMLYFVRNEKGKAIAMNGQHDDLIMALAIAYIVRYQQDFVVDERFKQEVTILDEFLLGFDNTNKKKGKGGYIHWD